MKVLAAVCVTDYMPTASARSLVALARSGVDVVFVGAGGLARARNGACKGALQEEYDALVFIDSDMVFTPEHFQELVRHASKHDYGVVCGRYVSRDRPHRFHAYVDGKSIQGTVAYDESQEVDYTGAGFLYIHSKVLRDVPEPWFDVSLTQGEDAYFCHKARAHGYPARVYPYVTLGHVGTIMYSDPQYEKVKP